MSWSVLPLLFLCGSGSVAPETSRQRWRMAQAPSIQALLESLSRCSRMTRAIFQTTSGATILLLTWPFVSWSIASVERRLSDQNMVLGGVLAGIDSIYQSAGCPGTCVGMPNQLLSEDSYLQARLFRFREQQPIGILPSLLRFRFSSYLWMSNHFFKYLHMPRETIYLDPRSITIRKHRY